MRSAVGADGAAVLGAIEGAADHAFEFHHAKVKFGLGVSGGDSRLGPGCGEPMALTFEADDDACWGAQRCRAGSARTAAGP